MADPLLYDSERLAPLDFVFVDGGDELEHVQKDSGKAYDALAPGGWPVWHDFHSPCRESRSARRLRHCASMSWWCTPKARRWRF
jgi:hypothetical protein